MLSLFVCLLFVLFCNHDASTLALSADGYVLRLFAIGFTKRRPNQVRKTSYAQSSQIRKIRRKMMQIMRREAAGVELKDLVIKMIPESIGKQIEKECQSIYPLKDWSVVEERKQLFIYLLLLLFFFLFFLFSCL